MQPQRRSHLTSVFCAAAPSDASWLTQWERHLLPLQQTGYITIWSENHLLGGESRLQRFHEHMDQAGMIFLLLSVDFFASKECLALMERAVQHQKEGTTSVILLILRPVMWQESSLASLPYLPSSGIPITSWDNPEEAFHECIEEVLRLLGQSSPVRLGSRLLRASTVQQQNRERMLQRLRRSYEDLMHHSLQGAVRLELGLAEKPAAVQNAARLLLRLSNQTEQPLPSGTSILQVYEKATHELLILGEPGAGKSSLLLDLARYLRQQAEINESHPLPVILPLSSWAVKRPLLEVWIAEQLAQIYDVPHQISEQWVHAEQILPLLDGLDEMEQAVRPACIAAINVYHRTHLLVPLVVCSRTMEYELAAEKQRLSLQNAVVVQPLAPEQVDDYLLQGGKPLIALRSTLRKNTVLQHIATTPLMLSILVLTYQGTTIQELPEKASLLSQQIWTDYIKRMVERKGNVVSYPLQQACLYLGWLARQMRKHNQTVFYLEDLQLDWLTINERSGYTWLAIRLPAILIGVLIGLLQVFFFSPHILLIDILSGYVLLYAILGGFLGWLWGEVVLRQSTLSTKKRVSHFVRITQLAASCVIIGLLLLVGLSFRSTEDSSWWFSIALFVPSSLILRPLFVRGTLHHSLHLNTSKTRYWQRFVLLLQKLHIRQALLVAITLGLSTGLSIGLSYWLRDGISPWLREGLGDGMRETLSDGLGQGLASGLSSGLDYGLMSILIGLVVKAQAGDIHLTERLKWTWDSLKKSLLSLSHLLMTLLISCLVMLLVGSSQGVSDLFGDLLGKAISLSYWQQYGLWDLLDHVFKSILSEGLSTALSIGLSYWLLFGVFQGIAQEQVENRQRYKVNQGIRRSLRNSIIMGTIGVGSICIIFMLGRVLHYGLVIVLDNWLIVSVLQPGGTWVQPDGQPVGLTFWLNYGREMLGQGLNDALSFSGLMSGLFVGVVSGSFVCLLSGGVAVLRHYVARFLFWRSPTFPWQAITFLDDATTRILLRRVGGGYSFSHRLLLDHFASGEIGTHSNDTDHDEISMFK